jgi:hypothetical protein
MKPQPDLIVVGWRAWYTDGRVFDSAATRWEDLPEHGVLVVLLYHRTRPYSRTMSGRSLYWREVTPKGSIYACDETADAIIPKEVRQANCVKYGKWVTDNEMLEARLASEKMQPIAPNESLRVDKGV